MKHLIKRTRSRQSLKNTLDIVGLPGPTIAADLNGRGIIASGSEKNFRLSPLGRKIEKGQLDFVKLEKEYTHKTGISTVSALDVFYNFDVYNSLLIASDVYDLNTSSSMGDIHIAYNNFITPRYGYAKITISRTSSNWTRIKFDFLNTVNKELGLKGLRIPAKNPNFAVGKNFGRLSILDIEEWIPDSYSTTSTQFYAVVPSNTSATQEEIELAIKMLDTNNAIKYYYYEDSLSPNTTYTKPSQLPLIQVKDEFDTEFRKSSGEAASLDRNWNIKYTTNIEDNSYFASMCKFMLDYYDANSFGKFGYANNSFANSQNDWKNCYNNNRYWKNTEQITSCLKNISSFSEFASLFNGESFCVEFIWSRYCDLKNKIVATNIFDCRMDPIDLATFDNFVGGNTADEIKQSLTNFGNSYSKYRNGVYAKAIEIAFQRIKDYQSNGTFKISFETNDGYYFGIKYLDTNLFKIGLDITSNGETKKVVFNIDKDSLATNSSEVFITGDNGKCWTSSMGNSEKPVSNVYDKSGGFSIYCKQGSLKYLIDMVVYIDDDDNNNKVFLKYTVKNMSASKTHDIS